MLNTSHEFLENLLDSAPDGIILLDAHGVLERVNQQMERLFGYEKGEMVGLTKPWYRIDLWKDTHVIERVFLQHHGAVAWGWGWICLPSARMVANFL